MTIVMSDQEGAVVVHVRQFVITRDAGGEKSRW